MPGNGEEDRFVQQFAEVVSVVSVLPKVIPVDHQVFAERLLEAAMKLIALARRNWSGRPTENRVNEWILHLTGENQVFVERSLHNSRIGGAEDGAGGFDVVSKAQAGFQLGIAGEAAVEIGAHACVDGPVALGNGVLDEHRSLPDVAFAIEGEQSTGGAGAAIVDGRRWPRQIETSQQRSEGSVD